MFQWERRFVLKVYKRKNWANQGWATSFGENPDIGKLISEGKQKLNKDGKTTTEIGAENLKDWIWNTDEGQQWRNEISERKKNYWDSLSTEDRKKISNKRSSSMDFKAAREKAQLKFDIIGEDGLTLGQRMARKGAKTRKERGIDDVKNAREANGKFDKRIAEMSDSEFEEYLEDKSERFKKSCVTRRNAYLSQMEVTNSS